MLRFVKVLLMSLWLAFAVGLQSAGSADGADIRRSNGSTGQLHSVAGITIAQVLQPATDIHARGSSMDTRKNTPPSVVATAAKPTAGNIAAVHTIQKPRPNASSANLSLKKKPARQSIGGQKSSTISTKTTNSPQKVPSKAQRAAYNAKHVNDSLTYCYNMRYKPTNSSSTAWKTDLLAAAEKLSRKNSIVVTGGDWAYRATVLNWMAHADNIGMTEYIVLCYGESMLKLVGSWQDGGHGLLVEDCSAMMEIMFMKVLALFYLNSAGYIVTWSDSDAVWLRPFMVDWVLPYQHKVDFLAQKAQHPKVIYKRTGSAICTGLYTVFPSRCATAAMQELAFRVGNYRTSSDQQLVNTYLDKLGIFDFKKPIAAEKPNSTPAVILPEYKSNSSGCVKVGFLPFGVFPRSHSTVEWVQAQKHNPAVWHSYAKKLGESKVEGMKNEGVFALRDGWETATAASEVPAFINHSIFTLRKPHVLAI